MRNSNTAVASAAVEPSNSSSMNLKSSVRNMMRARKLGKSLGRIESTLPPRKPVIFEEEDLKAAAAITPATIAGMNAIANPMKLP